MEKESIIMEKAYYDYEGRVCISPLILIVELWNKIMDVEEENKIFPNDKEFFENKFNNPFDAAWAASSGDYRWDDEFVFISADGRLTSFSRLDESTCPIDLNRLGISSFRDELDELIKEKEKSSARSSANISEAIQDALKDGGLL